MSQFKVRDLMVNALTGSGTGSAGLFLDTPPTPATPITPIAAVAAYSPRFESIDNAITAGDRGQLDVLAQDIGRGILGARAVALCAEEAPTCADLGRISPYAAAFTDVIFASDFGVLKGNVAQAEKALAKAEGVMKDKLAPELRKKLCSS